MPLTVGIVGLPNAGKTTLFNALTLSSADASNYPFCTIEPNVGVVEVPDSRLDRLNELLEPSSCTAATVLFTDIAGLVRGASRGEGRGNEFLRDVRETDALLHVVRCFSSSSVSHVEKEVDPLRDVAVVDSELMLSDLQVVEPTIPTLDKVVAADRQSPQRLELEMLKKIQAALEEGIPAHALELAPEQELAVRGYGLLSAKPMLYVANVGEEGDAVSCTVLKALRERVGADSMLSVSAQLEAEVAQLPADERDAFSEELGLRERGVERLIRASYRLLGLVTFYTHAHDKLRAWQLPSGAAAAKAAGGIHSDMERGFIKAEVTTASELEKSGHISTLRSTGQLRTEGRDYIIEDGDVVQFLFRA